jgi:hypothetical protein
MRDGHLSRETISSKIITMPMVEMNVDEICRFGLKAAGFATTIKLSETTNTQRFKRTYGVLADSVQLIISNIQNRELAGAFVIPKPNILHLLMTLRWMKTYGTEVEISGIFKCDEKSFRGRIWMYVNAIQALKKSKVRGISVSFLFLFIQVLNYFEVLII